MDTTFFVWVFTAQTSFFPEMFNLSSLHFVIMQKMKTLKIVTISILLHITINVKFVTKITIVIATKKQLLLPNLRKSQACLVHPSAIIVTRLLSQMTTTVYVTNVTKNFWRELKKMTKNIKENWITVLTTQKFKKIMILEQEKIKNPV